MPNPNYWTRREFLKIGSAASLSALAAGTPGRALAGASERKIDVVNPTAKADAVILLWLGGGVAHTETFDPKPYFIPKTAAESKQVMSTFPAIDTVVDGIKLSKGLERTAQLMDRGAIIRSLKMSSTEHNTATKEWHTGLLTPPYSAPSLGAWTTYLLKPRLADMPQHIHIQAGVSREKLRLSAGVVGSAHAPFVIRNSLEAIKSMQPQIGLKRYQRRHAFFRKLVDSAKLGDTSLAPRYAEFLRSMEQAHALVNSPAMKAFDLSQESPKTWARYDTRSLSSRFGMDCLLARRLVEHGARFVTVQWGHRFNFRDALLKRYKEKGIKIKGPLKGHVHANDRGSWDTHSEGHLIYSHTKPILDQALSQLILDLENRGLLDRTLVIVGSEFSRKVGDTGFRPAQKTGIERLEAGTAHGHSAGANSVLMFGGGKKGGTLYGKTREILPCDAIENVVGIKDVHATIFHLLGISPEAGTIFRERPIRVTKDGNGRPIKAIIA